jgi:hypothetical protein
VTAELSLLFAAGKRPTVGDIVRHANKLPQPSFGIASPPPAGEGWVELLAKGLSFDCVGLAPVAGLELPPRAQAFGLPKLIEQRTFETIGVLPGPHLREGGRLLPLIRGWIGLGEQLAQLPGVNAVCWSPAASWMEPGYFIRIARDWLGGGAFPALGLTTLDCRDDGSLQSRGLAFFSGQEIRLVPKQGASTAQAARLAVRLIDELVYAGPVSGETTYSGPDGEVLEASAIAGQTHIQVRWVG